MHRSTVIECFGVASQKLSPTTESLKRYWLNAPILHRSYIADIERGARNPTLVTIKKLAKGLGVSLADLLSGIKCNGC